MKKRNLLATLLIVTMLFAFVGCGNNNGNIADDGNTQTTENSTNTESSEAEETTTLTTQTTDDDSVSGNDSKTLVVYFSHSGNTRQIAENIQEKLDADIFEIKTVKEYSSDYNTVVDEAQEELNDNARPELSTTLDNIEQYETIIIGYPIWWGDMPMAVYTFLDTYDLSGKTIAPFCTHGGSGLSGTDDNIREEEKDATVLDGMAISDSAIDSSDGDVEEWLQECGISADNK